MLEHHLNMIFSKNSTCRSSLIGLKATPSWYHNLAMSLDCKYNYNTIWWWLEVISDRGNYRDGDGSKKCFSEWIVPWNAINIINIMPGCSYTSFFLPFLPFSSFCAGRFFLEKKNKCFCPFRLSFWLLVYWLNPYRLFLRWLVHNLQEYMMIKRIHLSDCLSVMTFQSKGMHQGKGAERWAEKPALETMLICEHLLRIFLEDLPHF